MYIQNLFYAHCIYNRRILSVMTTRPVSLRFPEELYSAIQVYAKATDRKASDIVFTACEEYLERITPGLCSHCHTQNQPEAKYCSSCGLPVANDPDGFREYIKQTVKDVMEKMQNEKEERK